MSPPSTPPPPPPGQGRSPRGQGFGGGGSGNGGGGSGQQMPRWIIWVVAAVLIAIFVLPTLMTRTDRTKISYTDMRSRVAEDKVSSLTWSNKGGSVCGWN